MASAADVPGKYDVVIDGKGYTFFRPLDGSYLTSGRHHAEYGYTATFVERTNTSDVFGDNAQDFFLTAAQTDWSLGIGQDFLDMKDPDSLRRYRDGPGIDCSTPGTFTIHFDTIATTSMTFDMKAVCGAGAKIGVNTHCAGGVTNLYTVSTGAATDQGAHGSGTPNRWGMCSDGVNVYIAGSTRITKWTGAAFSSFSATANAGSLAYLNNALYSCDGSTLKTYDGAGTATTVFTWKDATNTALTALDRKPKLVPFGGKLLIFFDTMIDAAELWIYDGIATSKVAALPKGVTGYDCLVSNGVVFMSSSDAKLWYWANGTLGTAWDNHISLATANMPLGVYNGNVLFGGGFRLISSTGAVDHFKSGLFGDWLSSVPNNVLNAYDSATAPVLWPSNVKQATAKIQLSAIDYGNTLTKTFREVILDQEDSSSNYPSGISVGNTTLDYSADKFFGSRNPTSIDYTANGGVLPAGVTGKQIRVYVTISSGVGLAGIVNIKKVYVRAAPVYQQFAIRTYNLDLTTTPTLPTQLQDGSNQPLTGHEQAANLIATIQSTTPVTITDRFGTYTGVLEPDQCRILELHSDGDNLPANSGQFIATLFARQV